MNNPSPLIPQGTHLTSQGKSHIRIAVFSILAIHIVLLGALLLQGCKRSSDTAELPPPVPTNTLPELNLADIMPETATPPGLPDGSTLTQRMTDANAPGSGAPPITPPPEDTLSLPTTPVIPTVETTPPEEESAAPGVITTPQAIEHTVARGDTFSSLATKYKTTTRAIAEANPTVDPRRLQIGQKLRIPPAPVTTTATQPTGPATGPNQVVYTVKSGDTLSRIAKSHSTTVQKIMADNNLSTTKIRVGQKLVLPKP